MGEFRLFWAEKDMASTQEILHIKNKRVMQKMLRIVSEHHVFEHKGYFYKFPNYERLFH